MQERTSPPPRRPLQVHRTTIDPPVLLPEQAGDSSGADSADDSVSWPRNGQSGHRARSEGRLRRNRYKHMPPELIVTPAQRQYLLTINTFM